MEDIFKKYLYNHILEDIYFLNIEIMIYWIERQLLYLQLESWDGDNPI